MSYTFYSSNIVKEPYDEINHAIGQLYDARTSLYHLYDKVVNLQSIEFFNQVIDSLNTPTLKEKFLDRDKCRDKRSHYENNYDQFFELLKNETNKFRFIRENTNTPNRFLECTNSVNRRPDEKVMEVFDGILAVASTQENSNKNILLLNELWTARTHISNQISIIENNLNLAEKFQKEKHKRDNYQHIGPSFNDYLESFKLETFENLAIFYKEFRKHAPLLNDTLKKVASTFNQLSRTIESAEDVDRLNAKINLARDYTVEQWQQGISKVCKDLNTFQPKDNAHQEILKNVINDIHDGTKSIKPLSLPMPSEHISIQDMRSQNDNALNSKKVLYEDTYKNASKISSICYHYSQEHELEKKHDTSFRLKQLAFGIFTFGAGLIMKLMGTGTFNYNKRSNTEYVLRENAMMETPYRTPR